MLNLMKMAAPAQLHSQHYNENDIMGLQTSGYRAYLEGWHTCTLVGAVRRMRTRIGLLAQPESMRSIIGATQ